MTFDPHEESRGDFGRGAGSAYAQFLWRGNPPQLESGQEVQSVTQHKCNHLHYTHSEVPEEVLVLTAHDMYVSEFNDRGYEPIIWMNYYSTHATKPLVYSNM